MGREALGSPMLAQLIMPPLITILGLAPKNCGSQSTRSAYLPTSTEPMRWLTPCVMAGLIVSLAT